MNRTFRFLAVGLFGLSAAGLGVACSSGDNPGNYGDACTVYAVGPSCTGSLLCRCQTQTEQGCFCTQPCTSPKSCPGQFDICVLADDPSQPDVLPADFCFQALPDGGALP
jgi:hypothetical protein